MIRFLLDENVTPTLASELQERAPTLDAYFIGDGFAPPWSTPDPDILVWMEAHDCILLTYNRSSMPVHLQDHIAAGRHVLDIVQLNPQMSPGEMMDDLLLIWGAGLPGEFQDRIVYLPLRE